MQPSWDDLRIFLSLAREGTLTTAAKALGVSHPTVARRVQALEGQIGARLFDRLPDRFVPTAAGEELLADTEAMEKAALSINRRSAPTWRASSAVIASPADNRTTPLTVSLRPALRRLIDSAAFSIASVSASSSSPAAVGTKRSGRRSNSRAPICLSSAWTRRATVGWLTPSVFAAVVSVPSRAKERKIRRSSQFGCMYKFVQGIFPIVH